MTRHGRAVAAALAATMLCTAAAPGVGADAVALIRLQLDPGLNLRLALRQAGVRAADANGAAFILAQVIDVERPPAQITLELRLEPSPSGDGLRLIALDLRRQGRPVARLTRAADTSWRLTPEAPADPPAPRAEGLHATLAILQGPMEDVLYGEPGSVSDAAMILKAARLFARKLDMTRDSALGDRVRLVFTRTMDGDGRVIGDSQLLYAELDTRRGPTRLYRHQRPQGEGEFVDQDGAELDRALLRTPLDRPRITSGFGMRLHPLLGYTRMHQGLDFGAPIGAQVIAAGDGVVEAVRWAGGYGREIRLRHAAGLETVYGHLSGWAPGLRAGSPVRQGQLIGYVGSSGLSTGPHLHYEVLEASRPVDPSTVQARGANILTGAERVRFEAEKRWVAAWLLTQARGAPGLAPVER